MASVMLHGKHVCPECLCDFTPKRSRALFCSEAHRTTWHNRQTVRGRVLTSLAMAARETRGGTRGDTDTGKKANWQANQLMQDWRDEDRRLGRMSQVEYLRRRFDAGFDSL
jgi:hypothetical protein